MTEFKFYTPIAVRYIDLDAQWHVNNAHFFSFIEQARYSYLVKLGLFDGQNFLDFPVIVADAHLSYQQPIPIGVQVEVGVAVTRIGNKSLRFEYVITDPAHTIIYATGDTTNVTYDFHTKTSIPVPPDWREKINRLEGANF